MPFVLLGLSRLPMRRCWLVLLLLLTMPTFALAERSPPDVVSLVAGRLEVPPAPADFESLQQGRVRWEFHRSSRGLVEGLSARVPELWRRLEGDLGRAVDEEMRIRVVRGPREMRALAPDAAPPPEYAVGVAYPGLGLILLSVVAPDSWMPPDLEPVLMHELSHVALHRAVEGQALPLWFVEGLAVVQAREQGLARIQALWEASVASRILPIRALAQRFPARSHEVNLAYAQSADVVSHLLHRQSDHGSLPGLVERVAQGASFEEALLGAYRIDLDLLESEWRQGLRERFHVVPLLLSGSFLWVLIAILAAVAFVRQRREQRERLEAWAVEEAAEQERIRLAQALVQAPAPSAPECPDPLLFSVRDSDPSLPTVEYEGQRYTLH